MTPWMRVAVNGSGAQMGWLCDEGAANVSSPSQSEEQSVRSVEQGEDDLSESALGTTAVKSPDDGNGCK